MAYYDFLQREIEGLSRLLAKTFFHKDIGVESILDENGVLSGEGYLRYVLFRMVGDGKINEAENLLFEQIEQDGSGEYLALAVEFYHKINSLSDEALAQCDFPREEIAEGLSAIIEKYGLGKR